METRRKFLKGSAGVAGLFAASSSSRIAANPNFPNSESSIKKNPRLIYNDDGNSVAFIPHRFPMKVEELTDMVDQLVGTQVDRFVYCLVVPRVFLHDTKVGERAWELRNGQYSSSFDFRRAENARHLVEAGHDPVHVLGQRAHKKGLQYFVSQRMNDAHFAYSSEGPEKNLWTGTFWHQNPEVRIGGNRKHYLKHLFDFSYEKVHEFHLGIIEETCQRYDIDGFELDFMRHPFFFKPEEARQKAPIMTEFVRKVRRRMLAIGKEKGRKLELQVLVPRTLKAGLESGLDINTWVEENLVDLIVPKHFILFNMDVPVEEFLRVTSGTLTKVAPGLEQRMNVSDEKFRAAASRYWQAGVDSLYLYNFFNHRPHPLCQEDRKILQEIGNPESIKLSDKHYFVMATSGSHDLADEAKQLPRTLDTRAEGHAVSLIIGDELKAAANSRILKVIRLKLGVPGITPEIDEWDVYLNGELIPHSQQECEADPVAFRERWIEIDLELGPYPRCGKNEIRFFLRKRNQLVAAELVLTDVELLVEYR